MVGIVDVGGGMRCIYSSGIYDCFLKENIKLDYCLGVSAGSANLVTYIAGQMGRTRRFYSKYAQRSEYMGTQRLIRNGSYIDLDYVFSSLSNEDGEDPLDFDAVIKSPARFICTATRASDGESVFFTKEDLKRNDYAILKASCAIPVFCKPKKVCGEEFFDGGVAEPIPFKKAFEDGCDKVIVVLTKPRKQYAQKKMMLSLSGAFLKKYPEVAKETVELPQRCAALLEEMESLEKEGKVFVLEPDDCMGADTLTRDKYKLLRLYSKGYRDALYAIKNESFFKDML